MVRTQIQLTEQQARRLKRLAAAEGLSMAELIRRSVDELLASPKVASGDQRRQRAAALSGRFRSGVSDLSSHHDRHLAEAFKS
jgi:Arc/MetJ-type ribon-helix-helix transcriptional regulator